MRTVTAPDGRNWTVRRRFPRGPRWWRPSGWDISWDVGLGTADDAAGVVAEIRSRRVRGIFASRSAVGEAARELERGELAAASDTPTT